MVETNLRECPFCGFPEPELRDIKRGRPFEDPSVLYFVQCPRCWGRTGSFFESKLATENWNRRTM